MAETEEKVKTVTIIVDGTPHEAPKGKITYAQVVTLAYPDYPQHPEITYSVTYTQGHHEGILPPGGNVEVKDGMEFRVNRTGQS
jgi:Multiubiquitin